MPPASTIINAMADAKIGRVMKKLMESLKRWTGTR
jgi:hypothetical protein